MVLELLSVPQENGYTYEGTNNTYRFQERQELKEANLLATWREPILNRPLYNLN